MVDVPNEVDLLSSNSIFQELRNYHGNPNLLLAGQQYSYSQHEITEFAKCAQDMDYFVENYIKIVHVDKGLIQFKPWDFQKDILKAYRDNNFVIVKTGRQVGKTTTTVAFILWYILFNKNVKVAILAHKLETAQELFEGLRRSYEHLPQFLQAGIAPGGWNKRSIRLGNGSMVKAAATSSGAIRGEAYNCVAGNSKITVRHIDTNTIIETTIEQLHDVLMTNSSRQINDVGQSLENQILSMMPGEESINVKNDKTNQHIFEIMGENDQFRPFYGIKKTNNQPTIDLSFSDGTNLTCTPDHKLFKIDGLTIEAKDSIGVSCVGKNGPIVVNHISTGSVIDVYDPIEIDNTHSFFANQVLTHQCVFLDEFAFVENNLAKEFFESVYPTISSGKSTKMFIVSCVTKDTILLTENGPKTIDSLIDHEQSGAYFVPEYSVRGVDKFRKSDVIVNNGVSKTFKISTVNTDLECSPNHKLLRYDPDTFKFEWVESQNLREGDHLVLEYGQDAWGTDDKIDFEYRSDKFNGNLFKIDSFTPDFSYLLGQYLGDGYMDFKQNHMVLSTGNQDNMDYLFENLGLNFHKSTKRKNNTRYEISSKSLADYFQYIGFVSVSRSHEKKIPERLFSISKENIANLVSGLFDADGTARKNRQSISITSTSKTMIEQLRSILSNFGILTNFQKFVRKEDKREKWKNYVLHDTFTLAINDKDSLRIFRDEIGFRHPEKKDKLNRIIENIDKSRNRYNGKDYIPRGRDLLIHLGLSRNNNTKSGTHTRQRNLSRHQVLDIFEKNGVSFPVLGRNVKLNVIKSITTGSAEVFDVSLPDVDGDEWCHSVLYNGLVGHQTPKGLNHYYEMWDAAVKKKSDFIPIEVPWNAVPGRDDEWAKKQIEILGPERFKQEFMHEFLGSSNTLISPEKLQELTNGQKQPLFETEGLRIFERPKPGYKYVICVDTSRGQGLDYHAFCIIDVTTFPYRLVGMFQRNDVHPTILPNFIYNAGMQYNEAPVLIEVSDIGAQVADMLVGDLDYDGVIRITNRPGKGQQIGFGIGGKVQNGLKTSPATKRIGCADLKALIESDKLIIEDIPTIKELMTFVSDNQSFAAEEGKHDDCVMSLVLFGWLSHQRYFRHENIDIREELERQNESYLESQLVPFGFVDDGLDFYIHQESF